MYELASLISFARVRLLDVRHRRMLVSWMPEYLLSTRAADGLQAAAVSIILLRFKPSPVAEGPLVQLLGVRNGLKE